MARNTVKEVGTMGILRDVKPHLLPSRVWSDGRNIRFNKNKVFRMGGVEEVLPATVTGLLNTGLATSATAKYLLYTTGAKCFSYDGISQVDITRAFGGDYSEDADHLFNIQMFNGLTLFNNGVDIPQQWLPGGTMENLINWDVTWTAKQMTSYKSILFALNMGEGVNLYPHRLRWSSPADPGALPSTWDAADPTNEAGIIDFSDTEAGVLVAAQELGDRLYVYKEGAIWVMNYIGGAALFSRVLLVRNIGLSVPRSLVTLPSLSQASVGHQFFAGDENFYTMDGIRTTPIFEEVFRREILKLVDQTNYKSRSFSVVNYRENELWFCVPEAGADFCTLAFCLNYQNNSYSIRELSGVSKIVSGIGIDVASGVAQADIPFDDETLFDDETGFDDTVATLSKSVIIEASPGREQLFYSDIGTKDYDGAPQLSYIERVGLTTIKNDYRNPEADVQQYEVRKLVTAIIPKLYAGATQMFVGVQEKDVDVVTWTNVGTADGSKYRYNLGLPLSGRFLSFKFESIGDDAMELGGFDYELNVLGEY